jgi:carboxymethylenebutenolidase
MYEDQGTIASLVHLYVDGAFSRRELIERVTKHTGSLAAAMAALGGFEIMRAQTAPACPDHARVPADAPDLEVYDVEFPGEAGTMFGHLAHPRRTNPDQNWPGVIVIHENRGLVEHIKDVTRRVARAGFVGLGVDLLSRQGGTAQFTEPTQQTAAYNRTTVDQRRADLIAALSYIKSLPVAQYDRIGTVGFCAGGANVWELAVHLEELAAAVPFYGAPPATAELIDRIKAPVLAIYAERDRNLTLRMAPVMTEMITRQKVFGMIVYEGAGHAFHNDTGAAYNPAAACDAWAQTIAWFNKHLRNRA